MFEKLDNFKSYDEFYITYTKHSLFKSDNKKEKIIQLISRIENSYIKKEFLKFNRNLIELLGTVKLMFHYYKLNNTSNSNELFSILFLLFTKIIQLNKNKIFFEVINSYEFFSLILIKQYVKQILYQNILSL